MKKEQSTDTELCSIYAGGFQSWRPDSPVKNSLCYYVWEEAGNLLPEGGQRITVDTSVLYSSDGKKLGFGSSAVAALLFSRALSRSANNADIIGNAVLAHRKWQQRHSSGYDIFTSANGGVGCFTGGPSPSWKKLGWPNLKYWLLRGPVPISSVQALRRYEAWKLGKHWLDIPLLADYYACLLETINLLASEAGVSDAGAFLEKLYELAAFSSSLGSAINQESIPLMPAEFSKSKKPWHRLGVAAAKSLGAGNEIVLLAGLEDGFTRNEQLTLKELCRTSRAFPLFIETRKLAKELPK